MFTLKIKKLSIIVGALASAITLSTFSGFAMGPTTEPLIERTIGLSSEIGSSSEQKIGNSVNEEIVEDSSPKVIELTTPGNYRLVGTTVGISNPNDPNEIIVNVHDRILIDAEGKFNVILDNVNINMNSPVRPEVGNGRDQNPVTIKGNADVNLTVVGKNSLSCGLEDSDGLSVHSTAQLTINGSGEDASLDAHGERNGIEGNNLTINGGKIIVTGKNDGIVCWNNLKIINSTIISSSKCDCIYCANNLTLNGATINAISTASCGIYCCNNSTITNSEIIANCKSEGITCRFYLKINDSVITASSNADGNYEVTGIASDYLETNNSKIKATRIFVRKSLSMCGGELDTDSINDVDFKHNMKNTFSNLPKMYGIRDGQGKLVWSENTNQNNNMIVGHHLPLPWHYGFADFYISGGTINGIVDFTPGTLANIPTGCLPFGTRFPGQGPKSELCNTEIFFNNK